MDSFKDLPPLSWHLRKEAIKMEEGLRKTLKSSPHVTPMISELPEEGRDAQSLIEEVGLNLFLDPNTAAIDTY